MVAGVATTAQGVSRAATRAWLPLIVALLARPGRGRIALVLLAQPVGTWVCRRPDLDVFRWTAAYLVDDAAYCTGLWVGALRARTLQPLLPAVPEWPAARRQSRLCRTEFDPSTDVSSHPARRQNVSDTPPEGSPSRTRTTSTPPAPETPI